MGSNPVMVGLDRATRHAVGVDHIVGADFAQRSQVRMILQQLTQ